MERGGRGEGQAEWETQPQAGGQTQATCTCFCPLQHGRPPQPACEPQASFSVGPQSQAGHLAPAGLLSSYNQMPSGLQGMMVLSRGEWGECRQDLEGRGPPQAPGFTTRTRQGHGVGAQSHPLGFGGYVCVWVFRLTGRKRVTTARADVPLRCDRVPARVGVEPCHPYSGRWRPRLTEADFLPRLAQPGRRGAGTRPPQPPMPG